MWKKLYIVGYIVFGVLVLSALLEMTKKEVTILEKTDGTKWVVEVEGKRVHRPAMMGDYIDTRIKTIKE